MKKVNQTNSTLETQKLAAKLALQFKKKGGIIALSGELGVGKTVFAQGFAQGLGIKDKVISPTFVLIRQHQIPQTTRTLFHVDLYRLEQPVGVKEIGLIDLWQDGKDIVLIEWAEKIRELLPKETVWIKIEKISDSKRKVVLKNF